MKDNKFAIIAILMLVPAVIVTIVGAILFGGLSKFFVLKAIDYYMYSIVISLFSIFARFGKMNWGLIPALLASIFATITLRSIEQYQAIPLPMLFLPLMLIFSGLNFITAFFHKNSWNKAAKALLFAIAASLYRTSIFFITQVFFKNTEMFNFMYQFQQGLLLFMIIGAGISISNTILSIEKKEEVDIVEKIKHYMDDVE
jgi:hypothetical protein